MLNDVRITLSHEELIYLLQAVQLPTLPGLPLDIIGIVNEDLFKQLLGMAERALRARGYINIEDNKIQIERALIGVLGFCASAPQLIQATRTITNGTTAIANIANYHLSEDLKVKHDFADGLHYFIFMPSEVAIIDDLMAHISGGIAVTDILDLDVTLPSIALIGIIGSRYEPSVPDSNPIEVLVNLGLSSDQAQTVNKVLRHGLANVGIEIWHLPNKVDPTTPKLGFIQTESGWVSLEVIPESAETRLKSLSSASLYHYITTVFSPYLSQAVSG